MCETSHLYYPWQAFGRAVIPYVPVRLQIPSVPLEEFNSVICGVSRMVLIPNYFFADRTAAGKPHIAFLRVAPLRFPYNLHLSLVHLQHRAAFYCFFEHGE